MATPTTSKELYKIFKYDREKLVDFLKSNCSYDYLKDLLLDIQNHAKEDSINIIKELFLGRIGFETNKQKAIYELPTNELLTIIKFICEFINIKNIEELAAGQGLLSHMLKHKLGNSEEYVVNASDGNRWIETSSTSKYYPVENKLVLQYCLDNNYDFSDKLLIISWLPSNDINDFIKLIEIKKPKYILLIGNNFSHVHQLFRNKLSTNDYRQACIPVKQMSYQNNSSIVFATNNSDFDFTSLLLNIKLKYDNCLCKKRIKRTCKGVVQDVVVNKVGNKFKYLYEDLNDQEKVNKIAIALNYILKKNITIPKYLNTTNEFLFWLHKEKHKKFPINIKDRNKFKEYYSIYNKINSQGGLGELIEKGVIPGWVQTIETAEKFLWLDFSTNDKKWKMSLAEFRTKFSSIQMRNGINTGYGSFYI